MTGEKGRSGDPRRGSTSLYVILSIVVVTLVLAVVVASWSSAPTLLNLP